MSPEPPRVLIVEDHHSTRRFLADNLAADGYEPIEAGTAAEALRQLADRAPDLAIFDLGLPDRDGLELLAELRGRGGGGPGAGGRGPGPGRRESPAARARGIDPGLPVLILSGRASEIDRVRGFERGGDDYLVKPFSYPELRARLAVLLQRRPDRPRAHRISIGSLEIDPIARAVWVAGEPVSVSKKEWALLEVLAGEPTRVFTRAELLRSVWGFPHPIPTRTLDSHASRLRRKLSRGPETFVVNVWGVGYRLTEVGPR